MMNYGISTAVELDEAVYGYHSDLVAEREKG
jgi:hypothetical protein